MNCKLCGGIRVTDQRYARCMTCNAFVLRVKQIDHRFDGQPEIMPLPAYQTVGASGVDLYAAFETVLYARDVPRVIPFGLAIEIPRGFEGQIRGRSSMNKKGIWCALGTIDSDYRGEIGGVFANITQRDFTIARGDRVAQLVIVPVEGVQIEACDELSATARGDGAFGSTGR